VKGRIARKVSGLLGLIVLQDKASLLLIDRALAFVSQSTGLQAA
jgi:hypothetical protein